MHKSFSEYYFYFLIGLTCLYSLVSIIAPELIIRLSEISNSIVGLKVDRKHGAWSPATIQMIGFLLLGFGLMILIGIYVNKKVGL